MLKASVTAIALIFSTNIYATLVDIGWNLGGSIYQFSLFDTSTNLEWLDLTPTYNISYNYIQDSFTTPGSVYEGFRFATQEEVLHLWAEAGISNTNFTIVDNGEWSAVKALADRLGTTPLGDLMVGTHALGMVADGLPINENERWVMEISYGIDGVSTRSSTDHYFRDVTAANSHYGSYLVRTAVVPVPAAVWLFGSGLLGLIGVARCKKA